jgi:small subunit ribosomal protein S6
MQTYDLNLILDPLLTETQIQTEKEAVVTQLQRAGGEIIELKELGKQRMSYEMRKQREGYYLYYTLKLPPNAPKAIELALRQRDNVMRTLVVRDRPDWRTQKAKQPA